MTQTTESAAARQPNDLESFWMPFTPNRAFKRAPRLVVRAKDMHYYTADGRAVLDGTAGLWCSNAGHSRDPIVAAIARQAEDLDYAPASSSPIRRHSNWRAGSRRSRRPGSTGCFSAIPDPKRSTPRSKSRSRTIMCAARARARG